MGKTKKYLSFQIVREYLSATRLALLAIFLFVLFPTHPFKGESNHQLELAELVEGKGAYELFKIYSILKSESADLGDALTWAIAKTIRGESTKHSLDPMLVLAVIDVESRFQHAAVSTEGARGLMQIRPFVADALLEELRLRDEGSLDDPILNIKLGTFYLYSLKKSFRDLELALTAYNWGPTEIKNRLDEDEELPSQYATKVLSAYQSYRKGHPPTDKKP